MRKKFQSFLERDRQFDEDLANAKFCNVAAAVVGAVATVGSSYMASKSANKAASAQAAGMDAAAQASIVAAEIQAETAREYLDFQKQQYADFKPLSEEIAKAQLENMYAQTDIMQRNAARAEEYADYERETFRPLERDLVRRAEEFDTEEERERIAERGIADVRDAYEQQRRMALDTLSRFGINPSSTRFAAINAQLGAQEAASSAGVANRSREQARDKATAMKYDAAALGRNLATNASTAYNIASGAGSNAVGAGNAALGTAMTPGAALGNAYGNFSNMMGNAGTGFMNAGRLYGMGYDIASRSADSANSALSSLVSTGTRAAFGYALGGNQGALGALGIKLADGGKVSKKVHKGKGAVSGPGGPVDDKIPAMLSDGEYVLPADTVKKLGKKNLDKLVKETHTPAAVQRRKALKGAKK